MVVDTVAEPHLLHICVESLVIGAFAVAVIVGVHSLEEVAHSKVVGVVLVPEDVAAPQCCLGKIVHKYLLIERKTVEVGHLIAKYLDVGKTLYMIVEIVIGLGALRSAAARR